jgi:hypothetical protein
MKQVIFENEQTPFLRIGYPSPRLAEFVEYYFEIKTQASDSMVKVTGLPSINSLIAIHLRNRTSSINERTLQRVIHDEVTLLGHTTNAFTGEYGQENHVFYIKLRPLAIQFLLRCPGKELLNNQIDLTNSLTGLSTDELRSMVSFQARIQAVEKFLLQRLVQTTPSYRQQLVALCLKEFSGSIYLKNDRIADLCRSHHVTYASLRRYFKDELGVPPKFYQKAIRFKSALRAYCQVGYNFRHDDYGYVDFSLFCKDAQELTGKSPLSL